MGFSQSAGKVLSCVFMTTSKYPFEQLASVIEGDLFYDTTWKLLYATDASVYREIPAAVCRPAGEQDVVRVLAFCREHRLPVIPRTAGTSLAGQVVGAGVVLDFSRYMNRILEVNAGEGWVRVQPGVILDELNDHLHPFGLFFGPETSTSNRCMIGGMVGNNACGSHSLVYGSTRDHLLELHTILSDGSAATFKSLSNDAFRRKCIGSSLENKIYRHLYEILSHEENQEEIRREYPDARLRRRNTGYALDLLLDTCLFSGSREPFNFCKLLAGSEGTLAIATEIRLNLVPLPPPEKALVCVHLHTVEEALHANLVALAFGPVAVELIDKIVLDCTRTNLTQQKNRFFIEGDPGAILLVEFAGHRREDVVAKAAGMEAAMRQRSFGYHFPVLFGRDILKVWALRKAGLGVLQNVPGDAKPVAVIEDAAVHVEMLPAYISDMRQILKRLGMECVFHAHIGTGELHLRPVLNMKNPADVERFYQVGRETALLVKKYRGSLSGEHGDGRVRSEFIPIILGEKIPRLFAGLKQTWDPFNILNPGKIVHPVAMRSSLRYSAGQGARKFAAVFDYPAAGSFLQAVERCNGSGDCRKPHSQGGVMCPSYHATLNECDTTRGRANILRELLTHSPKKNPFDHQEIPGVLDLCLACKACKSECPSNVDMARYKAEALHQYYLANGIPFRSRVIGAFSRLFSFGSLMPGLYNFMATAKPSQYLVKKAIGFALPRPLPLLYKTTTRKWAAKHLKALNGKVAAARQVYLFCDEFTNYNDSLTGIRAILLLHALGYRVILLKHADSGRALVSKGLLERAREVANKNVELFAGVVSEEVPLVGTEPSAIFGFRDEYPDMVSKDLREKAAALSKHVYSFEEFICREKDRNRIDSRLFSGEAREIYFHGHCHQKALSSNQFSIRMMSLPEHVTVKEIECGCCGMAGSFGYEKEHYALSMAIGELALFPAVRGAGSDAIIAASGSSCRAQIHDGTGRTALHPVDVLYGMLKEKPLNL